MVNSVKQMITKIISLYTQDEAGGLLGVSSKSIQNYLDGKPASKKISGSILELYRKLSDNNWERIPLHKLSEKHKTLQITPEGALLKTLVQEFADYKADKEGLDSKKIIRDIENKARIILEVVNRG